MDDGTDQGDGSSNQDVNCDQSLSGLTELESHQEDRPYKCNQCDKSYRHAGSLVNHKKTHQVGLYTCLICQKEYSNPMGLKSHLRTHSEEKRFKCEQCGEAFRMSQQLYNHRKSVHSYYSTPNGEKMTRSPKLEAQSPVLVESSNLMSNLENYIAESMLPVDLPQLVSKCYPDVKVEDEGSAKEDIEGQEAFTDEREQPNDSSIDEYRYKCTQCGKAYKHAGSLANHKQSHVVGVYQCAVCYKEFSNLMAMKNHCRLHSDSRARRSCKSPRSSEKSVHIERSDPPQTEVSTSAEKTNNPPSLPDLSENIKSEEEAFLIPHSPYQDELASSLSPLTKPNHDDLSGAPVSSVIESNNADETKPKASDLKVEQPEYDDAPDDDTKSGDRPFKCQECGKTYRHAGSLINHKKIHQTGVYSCTLCSKQMFNMATLKNHLRAHLKSRAGKRLGDAYYPSASLSDELYENQEYSFQCGLCDDVLTNESDFLQHQLLHQKQEIDEISSDQQVEEVPDSGIWQETPQVSQGSSDDSAYSSGPGFPDIKIEMDNLALQQWRQEDSLATPHEIKHENGVDEVQNADASFEQPEPGPMASKEADSSGLEELHRSTDYRPHKCDLCGRTYRHKSSLINHKLIHKTGVYQCTLCPKQYSNLMALRNHVRFHSNSYAGRSGIASRRGHQFFRTKPRFLQSKNLQLLADSVKSNDEIVHAATNSNGAVEEPLPESQSHYPCGKSFNCLEHLQMHKKSCPSTITSPITPTTVRCKEEDLSEVKELVESQEVTEGSENRRRRMYACNLCSKSYRHSGSLINHKRTHQTGDYMCPYCSKHVHNMAALKNHIRLHHKVKKEQQGELHADRPLQYSGLSSLPDGNGLYGCVSCQEMFHTETDLLAHQMVHIPLEGNQWDHRDPKSSSPEVNNDTTFTGAGDSEWNHSNNLDFHDEERKCLGEDAQTEYTCIECGEVYDRIDDLNDHKRSHQPGIYQCSFCPKEYPNLHALRSHFETHTKPQALRNTCLGGSDGNEFVDDQLPADNHYDCGHCGLVFSNEVDFHQHQVAHEKQDMDESLAVLHGDEQEPEFSFSMHSSERELLSRIKNEIEETERNEANDGGSLLSHICGFCGKTYDDLESLKAHSLSHSNENESSTTGNLQPETNEDENRQQHSPILTGNEGSGSSVKKEESPESRPYTCEQCGKTYRHGGSLVNHKKTHLVGNFQCVACSRHYPNLAAYRTHVRHHPKCKQMVTLKNPLQQPTSPLQDSIHSSGAKRPLTISPSSSVSLPDGFASPSSDFQNCLNYTTKDGSMPNTPSSQSYSRPPLNSKISRRLFTRRIERISNVQTSEEIPFKTSTARVLYASDVEDKKIQVCEFCGKTFGVKDLALHLSGDCGSHSAKLGGAPVDHNEEIQALPILPDSAMSRNEGETGSHWRPFRCEVCGRTYRHAGSLLNHKQTHKTGIFRCPICQKRFFNLLAMKNHNRIHFELKRHKCLDCGKAFRLRKQLDTHQRIHRQRILAKKLGRRNRKNRCRRFAQGRPQKSLMQTSSEGSSVNDFNDAGVKSSDSCAKREMDPDSRPYRCEECGRSYRHAGSLFNHKKSHKTGQYHCSICDKTYSNLMALKTHLRTHYEAKRHPCSQCGKTFKWKRQLFRHQVVHGREASQSDSQIPAGTEEAKTIHHHQEENSSVDHEASNFNNEDVGNDADSEDCEQTFQTSQEVISHNTVHTEEKAFHCPTCNHGFSCQLTLRHHQRTHEPLSSSQSSSDVLPSLTPNNELKLSQSGDKLQDHKDQGDRKYKCKQCGRSYLHAGSLFNHQKTHKIGLYKCPNCLKEFSNLLAFKNHLRTHRYNCKECGKTFRNSADLVAHSKLHEKGSLTCSFCNKRFICRSTFKHHLRIHSNQDGAILDHQTVSNFMVEVTWCAV